MAKYRIVKKWDASKGDYILIDGDIIELEPITEPTEPKETYGLYCGEWKPLSEHCKPKEQSLEELK